MCNELDFLLLSILAKAMQNQEMNCFMDGLPITWQQLYQNMD